MMKKDEALSVGAYSFNIKGSTTTIEENFCLNLWCRIMLAGKKIENINEPLVSSTPDLFNFSAKYEEEKNLIWGMFRRKSFKIEPLKQENNE